MSRTDVVVADNSDVLTASTAARLITRLVDAQTARGAASVVLTGGGTGIEVLRQVRHSPARDAVDWSRVDVYWGDERFLPDGDPERNETQAREALLDHVGVDPERVHPMAPSGGKFGNEADEAAAHYAEVLATTAAGDTETAVPAFDVLLLGIGEEGHTASLFPHTPYVQESQRTVVGVHDCPKPPPTRISLTLPAIRAASEVWLVVAGAGKAEAVSAALAGSDPVEIPAAGPRGRERTLWLLDREAAG
ncbi:6-phosphogluconolactonase [Halopolyspora algeriensis]|uniref:6-phosphogluconolactonase n=1 Tax=Halopolyspora algeriensis TaxID=1500506 RepID=A0A368VGE6_9ACTN|nr:6-phosphogluconolactonase [Halopolyspora algeriensis]RCW40398.1 6-phosphogluconolactonase [Halopolyspora algeriensis]TQM53682.1 6-phosphogluconolactonase [Halopolyspora algeriensis]